MRRCGALAFGVAAQFLMIWVANTSAPQTCPNKTVGVVLVVPSTDHLARNGWFTGSSCDFFDLREMNLYGAVFDAAHWVLSSGYRVVRVSVARGGHPNAQHGELRRIQIVSSCWRTGSSVRTR